MSDEQNLQTEEDEVVAAEPVATEGNFIPKPYESPYSESPDHVPNPYFQYAQVDTGSGVGARSISDISPVFDEHRHEALGVAVAELSNQADDASAHVVLSADRDQGEALEDIEAARSASETANPVSDEPNVGAETVDGDAAPGPQQRAEEKKTPTRKGSAKS